MFGTIASYSGLKVVPEYAWREKGEGGRERERERDKGGREGGREREIKRDREWESERGATQKDTCSWRCVDWGDTFI